MVDKTYIGPTTEQMALPDLINRTNRIKVMLWAGDAASARTELAQIRQDHGQLISAALKVKSRVTSANRKGNSKAIAKYKEQRQKGWRLDYLVKQELAAHTGMEGETFASLFVISPVASLITKLDKRISEETKQKEIFDDIRRRQITERKEAPNVISGEDDDATEHEPSIPVEVLPYVDQLSGFRLLVFSPDQNQWEMRAYQFNPPPLSAPELIANMGKLPDMFVERITEGPEDRWWPLHLRAFSREAYIRLMIFDWGRFLLNLTLRQGESEDVWFERILAVIAKSQQKNPPIDHATKS